MVRPVAGWSRRLEGTSGPPEALGGPPWRMRTDHSWDLGVTSYMIFDDPLGHVRATAALRPRAAPQFALCYAGGLQEEHEDDQPDNDLSP